MSDLHWSSLGFFGDALRYQCRADENTRVHRSQASTTQYSLIQWPVNFDLCKLGLLSEEHEAEARGGSAPILSEDHAPI